MDIAKTIRCKNISPLTFTYCRLALTTKAKLLGNVQGVVVHAIMLTSGVSSNGKLMITMETSEIKFSCKAMVKSGDHQASNWCK